MVREIGKKTMQPKLPTVKMLLEAGAHFGHETKRWHPNFEEYIYIKKGKFHIIDLEKTLDKLDEALRFLQGVARGGDVLFVGTKRQARDIVRKEAERCGVHFVVNRWVGGIITNFAIVSKSIVRLRKVEEELSGDIQGYSQQRLSVLRRRQGRLDRLFGGVKQLEKKPDVLVIIDAHYEKMAITEARSAGVPIVALVDSNTDPRGVDYPVPANDDAIKSINLFMKYFADAVLAGNKGKGIKHKFSDFSTVGVNKEKRTVVQAKAAKKPSGVRTKTTIKTKTKVKKAVVKKAVVKKAVVKKAVVKKAVVKKAEKPLKSTVRSKSVKGKKAKSKKTKSKKAKNKKA